MALWDGEERRLAFWGGSDRRRANPLELAKYRKVW